MLATIEHHYIATNMCLVGICPNSSKWAHELHAQSSKASCMKECLALKRKKKRYNSLNNNLSILSWYGYQSKQLQGTSLELYNLFTKDKFHDKWKENTKDIHKV